MASSDAELVGNLSTVIDGVVPLSEMSVQTYTNRMVMLTNTTQKSLRCSLTDAKESYSKLQAKYESVATRKNIVTAVVAVFKYNPGLSLSALNVWKVRLRNLCQMDRMLLDDNRATPAMEKKMIDVKATQDTAAKLALGGLTNRKQDRDHLLLTMMVGMPPKRADFGQLLVVKDAAKEPGTGNYVIVPRRGDVTLVMHEYKTAKSHGALREAIPPAVAAALRKSLAAFPRRYVFVGQKGEVMSTKAYTDMVRRVFKKHTGRMAGVNAIRHSYISHNVDPSKMTLGEMKALAESMGHSVGMQAQYQVVQKGS
jgi:hypothetical protein